MSDLELWYTKPAAVWTEALPIGNGRLGAMVFGDTYRERVQLNESTFFSGGPYRPLNPEAREHLDEVRALIFAGRYAEAEAIAHRYMMAKPYLQMSFQPIGDVWISFHHQMGARDYRRALDLDTAITATRYTAGQATYTREAFASPLTGTIAYRVTADQPGAISLDVGISSPQPGEVQTATSQGVIFLGHNRREQGIPGALKFGFGLRVLPRGGELTISPETLRVRRADSVLVLIDAATSYKRYDDISGDPETALTARLAAASETPFNVQREEHIAEHRRLFRALSIALPASDSVPRPTEERIATYAQIPDPSFAALYLQYGRYLKIASSRPGTQATNLQGLWNEELRPSWGSKYTTNINLEMNYWLPDPGNLAECFEPLIEMVEDLAQTGQETARVHYGASGWVLHHNTDLWRATGPVDGPQWGLWPMGGVWLCAQLWDHYQFSNDPALLARIYPLMRGAAEFMLDYLVPSPVNGALVTVPSLSPENVHPRGSSLCAGPAMDNQLLRDLFSGIVTASTTLGIDEDFRRKVGEAQQRLNPERIGKAGQLQEWAEDWDLEVPEPQHRHVSHLYAAYPSWQISVDDTPELAAAARRSLELRGDDATGWGLGWRLNLWARLQDGPHSAEILKLLFSPARTYPNMFDAHPPFQIDGNFGGAAGIIEMLVQSREGRVALLPALPPHWHTGSISGVRARGAFEVDLSWGNGSLEAATLHGRPGARTKVSFGRAALDVTIPDTGSVLLRLSDGQLVAG